MDWPVDHLAPLFWSSDVRVGGRVAALLLGALLFLECRWGLAGAAVQWNGKHAIPCSAWCRVTLRGCVMFLGYWLNDLGLHHESLNPRGLSACWQRDVSSTCLHIDPRTLLNWRVHIPQVSPPGPRSNLSTTLPVFHAPLAAGRAAIATIRRTGVFSSFVLIYLWITCLWQVNLFSFRCTDDMAGNSALRASHYSSLSQWVRKSRHRVKHRPLAGAEMTDLGGCPCPRSFTTPNHHMPFFFWKKLGYLDWPGCN